MRGPSQILDQLLSLRSCPPEGSLTLEPDNPAQRFRVEVAPGENHTHRLTLELFPELEYSSESHRARRLNKIVRAAQDQSHCIDDLRLAHGYESRQSIAERTERHLISLRRRNPVGDCSRRNRRRRSTRLP